MVQTEPAIQNRLANKHDLNVAVRFMVHNVLYSLIIKKDMKRGIGIAINTRGLKYQLCNKLYLILM